VELTKLGAVEFQNQTNAGRGVNDARPFRYGYVAVGRLGVTYLEVERDNAQHTHNQQHARFLVICDRESVIR